MHHEQLHLANWYLVNDGATDLTVPIVQGSVQIENFSDGLETTQLTAKKDISTITIERKDRELIQITDCTRDIRRDVLRTPVTSVTLTTEDPKQRLWLPDEVCQAQIIHPRGFKHFVELVGMFVTKKQTEKIRNEL